MYRIRLHFDTGPSTGRGILIPIESTKSIADLAEEASAEYYDSSEEERVADPKKLVFTLPDGTGLRFRDKIAHVLDSGDTVHVRHTEDTVQVTKALESRDGNAKGAPAGKPSPAKPPKSWEDVDDPMLGEDNRKRVVVAFRSAQLARNDGHEAPTQALGFGGNAVSVKLTMDIIRREAAVALGWSGFDDDAMIMDDPPLFDVEEDSMRGTCSCTLANQVLNQGVFDHLHCRKEIDGSTCDVEECKYSHARIASDTYVSSVADFECAICTEMLGFPCERCLNRPEDKGKDPSLILCCPLVQNAGCGHLFHAHCYFSQQDASRCPAGCPAAQYGKEPVDFTAPDSHILVVHSGSVIERVEIPEGFRGEGVLTLVDTQVLEVLQNRFEKQKGLVARMYQRNRDGLVRFHKSTTVSICCSSRHAEPDGCIRLELSPLPKRRAVNLPVDLHTASSPIYNINPEETIESLGLDLGVEHGAQVLIYVVKRPQSVEEEEVALEKVGKAKLYSNSPHWLPEVKQTDRGMAAFLSNLLIFCHLLGNGNDVKTQKRRALMYFMGLTRFPPAVRALYILMKNDTPTLEERRALSAAFYHLSLDMPPPYASGDRKRVFEVARLIFGTILLRAQGDFALPSSAAKPSEVDLCKEVNLCCEGTGERLRTPVILGDKTVEEEYANNRQSGFLFDPSAPPTIMGEVSPEFATLLRRTWRSVSWLVQFDTDVEISVLFTRSIHQDFNLAIRSVNTTDLKTYAPLSIKQRAITPALTLDDVGFNTVYISRGGACGAEDTVFLRPCHGEMIVDVNLVAARLEPVIRQRQAVGEWNVDAFADSEGAQVDARPVEEAVVVCLDLSRSMEKPFEKPQARNNQDGDDEDADGDRLARKALKDSFNTRGTITNDDLYTTASDVLSNLDCLPNIARLIPNRDTNPATARAMAGKVLNELAILHTRLHLTGSRNMFIARFRQFRIEKFVLAIENAAIKDRLITHLFTILDRCTEARSTSDTDLPPKAFLCPLSGKIMSAPVRASDGHVYERANLETWRVHRSSSPLDPSVQLSGSPTAVPALTRSIKQWIRKHSRQPPYRCEPLLVEITGLSSGTMTYVALSDNYSILSILLDIWKFKDMSPTLIELWSDLVDSGDGQQQGTLLDFERKVSGLDQTRQPAVSGADQLMMSKISLEPGMWSYRPGRNEEQLKRSRYMSRLDVAKQAFDAFVNKLQAFDLPVALGLVTFGKSVEIKQEITMIKENFRDQIRHVEADGDTPLIDSLSMAESMLTQYKREHPSARLRIVCLTDGVDVGSKAEPHAVCAKLQRGRIKLDSVNFQGPSGDLSLHAIAVATTGYSFRVTSLENALAIVELETVLSSKDRVETPTKPLVTSAMNLRSHRWQPRDEVTVYEFPGRKPHVRLMSTVVSAQKKLATTTIPTSMGRTKRLMEELRQVVNSPHPAIDVYACDEDIGFWKAVIEAPEGSPYVGGCFLLYVDFPTEYPQRPPEVRFITKILHPNINRHGKVCHAALDRSWVASMSMTTIFQVVYSLLLTPDTDNPLDLHATMEYNDDTGQHALKLSEMVQTFASKKRDEWRAELDP
ncbi:hypothetical protein JAAARDRAFT_37425 [Jaapia argillacea MUCL 33604]|uniref:RING-type E3 ubiquitin transferase n=1 Tax=Jaapia argillacea MUCL 33604 TaxID=933084 RepID=A0A067PKG2_9AGAM|nr:hypothetical protein JAAARDRAFT_37425 [Jaapia argillacea MUCL 33604]